MPEVSGRASFSDMAGYHTVVQGECLASIAQAYDFFDYRTI